MPMYFVAVKRTCKDFKDDGYSSDVEYVIDPDRLQGGEGGTCGGLLQYDW